MDLVLTMSIIGIVIKQYRGKETADATLTLLREALKTTFATSVWA
jgi:hypothetical protein